MRLLSTVFALTTAFPLLVYAQPASETATPAEGPAVAPAAAASPAPAETMTAPAAPAMEAAVAEPAAPLAVVVPSTPAPVVFGWEALVDAYYLYNFTGDPKTQRPSGRQFDSMANSFTLNYAKLGMHADTDWVTLRMDLGAGHTAGIINGASSNLSTGADLVDEGEGLYTMGFLVQQAYAEVRPEAHVSISAGKFVTSAGAEVIEGSKNWLYSRSMLFYGIPLLHTGLRVNVALLGTIAAPELVLSLQLVNGWNNDPDSNSDKTYGVNLTYTPAGAGLTAALTSYIGKEVTGGKTVMLVDAVVLKDLGPLSLGINLDYFKNDDPYWFGVAGMGRYIINDMFNVAARAEYIYSKNGGYAYGGLPVEGDSLSLYEFTGMVAWTVDKHYELRAEVRADMATEEVYTKGTTPRKNQVTGLLAALAYF